MAPVAVHHSAVVELDAVSPVWASSYHHATSLPPAGAGVLHSYPCSDLKLGEISCVAVISVFDLLVVLLSSVFEVNGGLSLIDAAVRREGIPDWSAVDDLTC